MPAVVYRGVQKGEQREVREIKTRNAAVSRRRAEAHPLVRGVAAEVAVLLEGLLAAARLRYLVAAPQQTWAEQRMMLGCHQREAQSLALGREVEDRVLVRHHDFGRPGAEDCAAPDRWRP